jgi:hypothetical protein
MGNQHTNKNKPSFWTEHKLAKLKKLRKKDKKSFGKIGKELGATKNQVLAAWNRKIIKKKFRSDLPEEERPQPIVPSKPTLAWVPGVGSSGKYKTGVLKYD